MDAHSVKVHSLVHRPAVYAPSDMTLRQLALLLTENEIGAALVRGPSHAEGLVSERDIVVAIADGSDPDQTRVSDVMAEELVTIAPKDDLLAATLAMLDAEVRHLPVVEDGVHFGMISARDALAALVENE
ncbi:MAG: CBS domain-containing protein [Acidimicrobiia bacterium]|nr:CBS domain-containing protein [Acidimicrobiia bacterium]